MATPIKLASGLGGAIGSDYVQSKNQLYFVESNGKLSVLDLVRQLDTTVFSGTATMPADTSLDLANGTSAQGGHIRWDHNSPDGKLVMRGQGNCGLSLAGAISAADFDALTHAELQNLSYSQQTNPKGEGPNNQLTNGTVFGVFNSNPSAAPNFDYVKVQVVQNAAGSIKVRWTAYRVKPRLRVLGTGYNQPQDIKVTSGGRYAYVTEGTGNLLQVDLTNANRAAAQVKASGLTAPRQIALDEAHGQAYVPESTGEANGKIWRIDLSGGVKTAVFQALQQCTGLLITKDLRFAFVTEQVASGHRLARINLATAQRDILVTGLNKPSFMEWADGGESSIIFPERDANHIDMIDLTATPIKVTKLLTGVPSPPSSIVMTKPGTIIVCCDSEIDQYDLSSSVFSLAGPLFMGIGLVPIDRIINAGIDNTDGYADTTNNLGYMLQVKDAPFGGSLAIMINHNAALLAGARYYKLFVNQVTPAATLPMEPRQSFSDYLWNAASTSFVPRTTGPDAGGFYPVRLPIEIWYNPLLGYMLDSSILNNGLCVIDIKLYNAAKVEIPVGSFHSRRVKIDNQWPVANLEKILHVSNNGVVEVKACDIVDSGTDEFQFQITATDPQGHMLSWSLSRVWGDNQSGTVSGDSYSNHPSVTRQWKGVVSGVVPTPAWHATVAGDNTSKHCAHTFYLGVWDRVINGYGYIHSQGYHKSITIWL